MLTKLKQRFQSWIAWEARLAHNLGFTPNHVSVVGMLFAVFSGLAYWNWHSHQILMILAPAFLLTSGFCDALDGAIARIYAETTTFGGFLDSLLDRYADGFVLCGIVLGGLCHPFWGLTALMGSLLVSYVRARAEAKGVEMEWNCWPMRSFSVFCSVKNPSYWYCSYMIELFYPADDFCQCFSSKNHMSIKGMLFD